MGDTCKPLYRVRRWRRVRSETLRDQRVGHAGTVVGRARGGDAGQERAEAVVDADHERGRRVGEVVRP